MNLIGKLCLVFLITLMVAGCVNVDPETGKTIPRGNQKHKYSYVEQQAAQLHDGMTKLEVLLLLGSPAETSADGNVWAYLPERPAVLVPSQGLRLVFQDGILKTHEFTLIVFGEAL